MPTQQELNDKYKDNLSIESLSLIPRDQFGNISVSATDTTRDILIERVNWVFDNPSINKVIETRFSYYKFPPKINITDIDDIPIDILTGIDTVLGDSNAVNIMLKPVNQFNIPYMQSVVTKKDGTFAITYEKDKTRAYEELKQGDKSSGRYNLITSKDTNGNDQQSLSIRSLYEGSFREIPFTTQLDGNPMIQPGRFVVTKDILSSNKNIKFEVNIAINHLCNDTRILGRLIRYKKNDSKFYEIIKGYSHLDLSISPTYKDLVNWVDVEEKTYFTQLGWTGLFKWRKEQKPVKVSTGISQTLKDAEENLKTQKSELAKLKKTTQKYFDSDRDKTYPAAAINDLVREIAYFENITHGGVYSEKYSPFGAYVDGKRVYYEWNSDSWRNLLSYGLEGVNSRIINDSSISYKQTAAGNREYLFNVTNNSDWELSVPTTFWIVNSVKNEGKFSPWDPNGVEALSARLSKAIDRFFDIPKQEENATNYSASLAAEANFKDTTLKDAETRLANAKIQYNNEIARLQTIDVFELILNGEIAYLKPGSSIFNFSYVVDKSELELYDVYAVEILSGFNDSSADTIPLRPELIEDSTYWSITSTDDPSTISDVNDWINIV